MGKYKAKRLERGRYLYRGFIVEWVGYVDSLHHNGWQAHDDDFNYFAQSGSLKETKMYIDTILDEDEKKKAQD